MAVLYNGLQRIAPVVVEGAGTSITATNKSSSAVSAGDKVWINVDNGNYDIIDFATTETANFTIHGSPTINNKVVSNFSMNNYLTLLNYFKPGSYSWEMVFKINVPSHQMINFINWFSVSGSDSGRWGVSFGLYENTMFAQMSSTGNSWDLNMPGLATLSTNTNYWIKLEYDQTKYIMSYSTDGINYIIDVILNNSTPVYNNMNGALIGGYNIFTGGLNTPFNGYLDLSKSYIKINGEYWWTPYSAAIEQSSITGKAEENIAISGTGQVSVIL